MPFFVVILTANMNKQSGAMKQCAIEIHGGSPLLPITSLFSAKSYLPISILTYFHAVNVDNYLDK